MNYQAYYITLAAIVALFSLAVLIAAIHNRRSKAKPEPAKYEFYNGQGERCDAVSAMYPMCVSAEPIKALKITGQGSSTAKRSDRARQKVIDELNRRTEHWAERKRKAHLAMSRKVLVVRELKKLVTPDEFTAITSKYRDMPDEQVLLEVSGK